VIAHILLHEAANVEVICVIRSQTDGCARERLLTALEPVMQHTASTAKGGILPGSWKSRLTAVAGDVSLPLLGLDGDAHASVARRATAVLHAAAEVKFLEVMEGGYDLVRAANVLSCGHVAALALKAGAPLHFVSTASVVAAFGPRPDLAAALADRETLVTIDAYALSKLAAEACLVRLAAEHRGALCLSISRPPLLTWCSAGCVNGADWLNRLLSTCVFLGAVPDPSTSRPGQGWDSPVAYAPVDAAAAAIGAAVVGTPPGCGAGGSGSGASGFVAHVPVALPGSTMSPAEVLARLASEGRLSRVDPLVWRTVLASVTVAPFWPLLAVVDPETGQLAWKTEESGGSSKSGGGLEAASCTDGGLPCVQTCACSRAAAAAVGKYETALWVECFAAALPQLLTQGIQ